jgi:hypothetical protein
MRSIDLPGTWVVYTVPVRGSDAGLAALCSQREWDEMDRAQPGRFTLIRAGITNEGEAEQLARNSKPVPPAPPHSTSEAPGSFIPGGYS